MGRQVGPPGGVEENNKSVVDDNTFLLLHISGELRVKTVCLVFHKVKPSNKSSVE